MNIKTLFALAVVAISGCMCGNPSVHTETGIITRVASSGLLCTTTEGRMSVGYLKKDGSGTVSRQEFFFTIKDPELKELARKYQRENVPVELTAETRWVVSQCATESNNFVTAITRLDK